MTETPDELFDAHLDDALLVTPVPVPAPAKLKEQVLAKIAVEQQPISLAKRRAKRSKTAGWVLAAASVGVLAIGGGVYFSTLEQATEASYTQQEEAARGPAVPEKSEYTDEMPAMLQDSAAVLQAPDAVTTELDTDGTALTVVSSAAQKEAVVVAGQPATGDKQLLLWAIDASGEPVFVDVIGKTLWIPLPEASTGIIVTAPQQQSEKSDATPRFPSGEIILEHRF